MPEKSTPPASDAPFAWLCDHCHRHSYEEFPTREAAAADARRHHAKVHPGLKPIMLVAQKDKAATPLPGGFRTLCGACMGPIDERTCVDANAADEEGEIHRQRLHPEPRNVVIIVCQAWVFDERRKQSLANLRRLQREADHGGLKEPFGDRRVVEL
ncbi:MAG: hypothetical protein JRM86_05615 [Nitrososphaerota archaeon]|nr:hypothetical protein [Nitrososphaerota archaeon]